MAEAVDNWVLPFPNLVDGVELVPISHGLRRGLCALGVALFDVLKYSNARTTSGEYVSIARVQHT